MPVLTVVSGMRGKGLVSHCLEGGLGTNCMRVTERTSEYWLGAILTLEDVILLSTSGAEREEWMKPWIEKCGEPLYDIIVRRNRE